MTRQVPMDQPLSDSDRAYLHARGLHAQVERLDEDFPPEEATDEADEDMREERPDWENMTVSQLDAEIARVNEEYAAGLSADGVKSDKVTRLAAWWDRASE